MRVSKRPIPIRDPSTLESFRDATKDTVKDVQDLLSAMKRRRYNLRKMYVALGTLTALIGYSSYETITDWMSDRATDVTSKSLEDPQFIEDATKFGTTIGKQIVYNLSKDPEVKQIFTEFFTDLFTSEPIISAAKDLSNDVVHSIVVNPEYEPIRVEATELAKERIIHILEQPEVQTAVNDLVWNTINNTVLPWRWRGEDFVENKD